MKNEIQRLTDVELQQHREKGLCYRCDEKFYPGHRCKRKELSVMVVQEAEIEDEVTLFEAIPLAEISLNSVVGLTNPKTLRARGCVEEQPVVVLINLGATHNFISIKLTKKMKIPVMTTVGYGVQLGNGDNIPTTGICRGVRLHLQGVEIIEDFIPLQLGSTNVILGIQWLETIGGTYINWKMQLMKFRLGNRTVLIRGDPTLGKALVSLKAMIWTIKHEKHGVYMELSQVEAAAVESELQNSLAALPKELGEVLDKFQQLFQSPTGLPPIRGHDHAIIVREDLEPVNVQPYRYPQFQKDEVERLIKEMLAAGIIQPSTSPYSNPMLVVKKRDGSWRFCIDY